MCGVLDKQFGKNHIVVIITLWILDAAELECDHGLPQYRNSVIRFSEAFSVSNAIHKIFVQKWLKRQF